MKLDKDLILPYIIILIIPIVTIYKLLYVGTTLEIILTVVIASFMIFSFIKQIKVIAMILWFTLFYQLLIVANFEIGLINLMSK
jgi:hypothetical protein